MRGATDAKSRGGPQALPNRPQTSWPDSRECVLEMTVSGALSGPVFCHCPRCAMYRSGLNGPAYGCTKRASDALRLGR